MKEGVTLRPIRFQLPRLKRRKSGFHEEKGAYK